MKRIGFFLLLLVLSYSFCFLAQNPSAKVIDTGFIITMDYASDGNYLIGGQFFYGANLDIFVAKIDDNFNPIWVKSYGSDSDDTMTALRHTEDGNYILCGNTFSFSVSGNAFVAKFDSANNCLWQKMYGGCCDSFQLTFDGGYILAGRTENFAAWVVKLDAEGNIEWEKSYNNVKTYTTFHSIRQTSDKGYLAVGEIDTDSPNGVDALVMKLDSSGNIVWQKRIGGKGCDLFFSAVETARGDYLLAGATNSNSNPYRKIWLVKLASQGKVLWQKIYDSYAGDGISLEKTSDNCFIIGGQKGGNNLAFKVNSQGEIIWQKKFQVGKGEYASTSSILQEEDGSLIFGGSFSPEGTFDRSLIFKVSASGKDSPKCFFLKDTDMVKEEINEKAYKTKLVEENISSNAEDISLNIRDTAIESYVLCGEEQDLFVAVVQSSKDPFSLKIFGSGFQNGATVAINDEPYPYGVKVVNSNKILIEGGNKIKQMLHNNYNWIKVCNPDGKCSEGVYCYYQR